MLENTKAFSGFAVDDLQKAREDEPLPAGGDLEEARRYVRRKRIFYSVLGVWMALSLMWFTIDLLDDSSSFWFYWPMPSTGIAVAVTGIVLLGLGGLFGADWERREVDNYLRRRRMSRGVDSEGAKETERDEM